MEELSKKVDQILTQFIQEELGNRLSQFAMKALRDTIINEIKNYKPGNVKDEVKKDNAVSK